MSRCLDPQTPSEKAFRGSKHLLTRYLEDFGRLGYCTVGVQDVRRFKQILSTNLPTEKKTSLDHYACHIPDMILAHSGSYPSKILMGKKDG